MKTHLGVGKTESAMKKFMTVLSVVLMAAGFVSCKKEINVYGPAPEKGELKVRFIADASLTKVGLTPDENDENFSAVWDNDDYIGIVCTDKNDSKVTDDEILASWVPSGVTSTPGYFETSLDATSLTKENAPYSFVGYWPEGKTATELFPDRRKQNGDKYNGDYDIMVSDKTAVNFGATETNAVTVVLPMKRQTSIAYFHIKSELNEKIVSATLTTGEGEFIAASNANLSGDGFSIVDGCGKNSITLHIEGDMYSSDFKLWFNVLPVDYTSMKLVVETDTHSFTMSKKAAGSWKAGELNSVVIENVPADKWAIKETPSEPVEKTLSIAEYASANDWKNAIQYLSIDIDENLTVKCAGKSNTGKYYSNDKTWRMYQTEDAKVTFTLSDGYKFQDAKIIYKVDKNGILVYDGTNVSSNTSLNVTDKTSFELGVGNTREATANGNIQITSIYVKYIKSGSGSFDPANPNYAISVVGNIVGGTVTPSRSYAKETEKFTVTCEPSIGYEYVSESLVVKNAVTGENLVADNNGEYTMPAANVTVTASFSKIAYTINTPSNDRGTISVKIGGSEVTEANYGDEITLSATPDEGYKFISWSVMDNDNTVVEVTEGKFTMPASPVTVNAYFLSSATYTASFSVNGSIISTQTFEENDKIVFPENPAEDGYQFVGWAKSDLAGIQTMKPEVVNTQTEVMGISDITYYAVFGVIETAVFDASDLSATPAVSGQTSTWKHTASGITLKLSAGKLYTSGSPKTFTVNSGTSNYFKISSDNNYTISEIETTISENKYKINTVSSGATLSTSGTTQIVKSDNLTSIQCFATSSYQIRATKITVKALTGYSTKIITLNEVSISGSPTKTEYTVGEEFDPSGLTVTGTYSDGNRKDISTGIIWTSNPNPLTEGTTSVTVTAKVGSIPSAAYEVTGLTVTAGVTTFELSGTFTLANSQLSLTHNGITVVQKKVSGSTAVNSSYNTPSTLRVYKGHALTFSGKTIKKIEITVHNTNYGNSLTADSGTLTPTNTSGGTIVWKGNASSVTITNVASASNVQIQPSSIRITYAN